ncbi:MAG: phosphate/phosphite/phosphonate ABC transporter substrate-binding protein [Desulfobacterales bacterium]|nr:phosphate/phosphite/phosphonate ABC transporter substrate-binding protein [Desulfobacterales bacterium]
MRKNYFFGVIAIVLLLAQVCTAEYKIGVLAKRGAPICMQQWGATAAYLTEKLGEPFVIVPLKFEAIEPAVKAGEIDFVLANSAFYVTLSEKYQAQAIVTLINSSQGKSVKEFGGVVFVKQDSPIQSLSDIKGKRFMCVNFGSFGGGLMAFRLLIENNIDPKKDCAAFLEGNKHDNVVLAVLNGTVDAGTVRSDTLERMQEEGKIKLDQFRILNQMKDDFPFVHSTRLYPEWPMAKCPKTDTQLASKVAGALKAMPADSEAAKQAKISGWADPLDYKEVKECLDIVKNKFGSLGEVQ